MLIASMDPDLLVPAAIEWLASLPTPKPYPGADAEHPEEPT